jgi:hypothetical protein
MKHFSYQSVYCLGLSILISALGSVRAIGAGCAVSDGSKLPSDDGCMLAFVYNQTDDHRLVIIDEKNRRRYEAPLKDANCAPFWEGGNVYVVDHSGSVRGFHVGSDRLVPEKEETISARVVREAEYVRSQHRLYLIQTEWNDQQKIFFYELLAIDFPARKTLWSKRIDDPGVLRIMQPYVCMTGLKLVQVFNCDTGEKLGAIEATKAAADANAHK